ncbi:uncharacterized protein LOC118509821 [Anopheles stephensi]|uniref:uncharacterized protein LOC118509821 n=1 Tax=Anopheles stephensi TaxID=30069 RepID=UPI001658BC1A|nr:uncharacterized protein LOC118509821 [Anopheles stephensi]
MENNKEDELDEVIESSQAPTLRSKIRQVRPNYRDLSPRKYRKKPPKRAPRDNRTVSQCIRQVWKNPLNKPSPTKTKQPAPSTNNEEALEKEYIKIASQQHEPPNVGDGIQPVPSVSLFAQQEAALARYLFNETTEAQVEEQLQKLLDGFQAEYEKECAAMESSPVMMVHDDAGSLQSSPALPGANGEQIASGIEENERPSVCPLQPMVSEPFLLPNFSEEIARLAEMVQKAGSSPFRSDPSAMADRMATPIIPVVELHEEMPQMLGDIPMVTHGNGCLDLTVQKEQSVPEKAAQLADPANQLEDDGCWLNVSQNRASPVPSVKLSQRPDDILDLRLKLRRTVPTPTVNANPRFVPPRPCARSTSDCGTQTKFRGRYRNVGIQHRPVASLDFTDRNIIVLAQQFEADPNLLGRKLRRVAQTACDPIWRARDLSTVFTAADPYYANLKHFL